MELRTCLTCENPKPLDQFHRHPESLGGRLRRCKECVNKGKRERFEDSEPARKSRSDYHKAWRMELKHKVFDYYGGKCQCCGESEFLFLTLDHVNNDGAEHRRQLAEGTGTKPRQVSPDTVYRELVKTDFAEADRFQVLCYNCNCAKRGNGGVCPHEDARRASG